MPIVLKYGSVSLLEPLGLGQACNWITLPLFTIIIIIIITAIELSLGGSSPYTSTEKTNKNEYT